MKRTFANRGLMSLLAGFFLFGFLLLSGNRAEAQTYNWMQSNEAKQVLLTEVNTMYGSLQNLTPGSQAYNDVLAHAIYYRMIYRKIDQGGAVEPSTLEALSVFSTTPGVATGAITADVTVDKNLKAVLYNDAVGLLTL